MEEATKKPKSYLYAVKLLAKRDYSVHKLKTKLFEKNFDEDEIEDTINTLIKLNYLREEEYARQRVRGLFYKNYSSDYIVQRLAQEKVFITREFIDSLIEEWEIKEEELVENLIRKKIKSLPNNSEDSYKLKIKIRRLLETKGFSSNKYLDQIEKSLNQSY